MTTLTVRGAVLSSVVSVRRPNSVEAPSIWSGTRLMLLSVLVGVVILGALVVLLLALWGGGGDPGRR
jgi:hypothetical protein